ncbi:unnamed protein product [Clonostachys rosea]|uniref:Tail specific protease domain-containing protein n=1 Tax=Bionectria ochroleuca TaxID=29856 RepID=A0ABY6UYR6_BIOOC|nr:unnamed protein product [Clonostachys rosea]
MRFFFLATVLTLILPAAVAEDVVPCTRFAELLQRGRNNIWLENPFNYPAEVLVNAGAAYECATSIPILSEDIVLVIEMYKKMLPMYSTLSFLKNPPESYQQPSIDVMAQLDKIAEKAKRGNYTNFYEYESDLSLLGYQAHDQHFRLRNAGMFQFRWYLPHDIVSVSRDGKEVPQVYVYSDIVGKRRDLASPIVQFGGDSVFTYLDKYARTKSSIGLLEPHAEWNALMYNPAVQFGTWGARNGSSIYHNEFRSTSTYNGKYLEGRFANGTTFKWEYLAGSRAVYNLTKITTGQSIYDTWISSKNPNATQEPKEDEEVRILFSNKNTTAFDPLPSVPYPSYPKDPIVVQSNFSRGGTVSGYLLSNNSIGVLSIPSFMTGLYVGGPEELHTAVAEFIAKSREAGAKKIVIDLSGNRGGFLLLAYDTFRQFFPEMDPFTLANARASKSLDTIGSVLSHIASGSIETPTGPLNRTLAQNLGLGDLSMHATLTKKSKPWKSWKQFFGPVTVNGDNYTNPWRYDFNATRVTRQLRFNMTGYDDNQRDYEQAFDPKDIIMLHDGHCGSACAVFSSLMKNIAGVKSVAVGGMPVKGPMQGVAGTRGCQVRQSSAIEKISQLIQTVLSDTRNRSSEALRSELGVTLEELKSLPSTRGSPWRDVTAGINTLNCLPTSNPEIPYQFLYEASYCRVFYTVDMLLDVTQLWKTAAAIARGNTSSCVSGSLNGPGSQPNAPLDVSPGFSHADIWKMRDAEWVWMGPDEPAEDDEGL